MFGLGFLIDHSSHISIAYQYQSYFDLIQTRFLNGNLLKNLDRHYKFLKAGGWRTPWRNMPLFWNTFH